MKDEALSGCHGLSLGLFPPPLFPSSAFSGFNHPLASSTEAMAIRVILASPRRVALPIFVIEPPGPSTFQYVYFCHARGVSPRVFTRAKCSYSPWKVPVPSRAAIFISITKLTEIREMLKFFSFSFSKFFKA